MTAPFKLPAYLSFGKSHDPVLCGADCELVCEMEGVTDDEARHILSAVNDRPHLIALLEELVDYATNGTLEGDEPPPCVVEAETFLMQFKYGDAFK